MSENRCSNCGGRMRLVNVTRINKFQTPEASLYDSSVSHRKALLGNLPKVTTQEMMCVCCGQRAPLSGKITTKVTKAKKAKKAKKVTNANSNESNEKKQSKKLTRAQKKVIACLIKFLISLAIVAVGVYFAYQYKDVLLGYWQSIRGIVGKIETLVEKARELVGNMKEFLGKFR